MSPHAKDSDCTVVDGVCIECGVGHGEPCTGIIFKLGDLCMGRGFHRPGCLESDDTDVDAAPQTPLQIALATAANHGGQSRHRTRHLTTSKRETP